MEDPKHIAAALVGASIRDRNPLRLLENLAAKIGYRDGYCIYLTDADRVEISECIRFWKGQN